METFEQTIEKALIPFREEYRQKCRNESVIGGFHKYVTGWLEKAVLRSPGRSDIRAHLESITKKLGQYPMMLPGERAKLLKEIHPLILSFKTNETDVSEKTEKSGESPDNPPVQKTGHKIVNKPRVNLEDSASALTGVGPRLAQALKRAELHIIEDLLFHLPRDYQDRREIKKFTEAVVGEFQVVRGTVRRIDMRRVRGGKTILKAALCSEDGVISLIWFNQHYMKKQLKEGREYIVSGKVEYKYREMQIISPELEEVEEEEKNFDGAITPVYPLTEGINQKFMRRIITSAVNKHADQLVEILPESFRIKLNLMEISQAIRAIHFPENLEDAERGMLRLRFEEAFLLQLIVANNRRVFRKEARESRYNFNKYMLKEFEDGLPFSLTDSQRKVLDEIVGDMMISHPMNRLLQGDVGSGKTIICVFCAMLAVKSGFQSAILAPTEILAEQHYYNFKSILHNYGIEMEILIGATPQKEKDLIKMRLKNGEIPVIAGTHALLQEDVEFKNLKFAVVDEQHKFGVMQRSALKDKGRGADFLFTTATPIPRSLCLTLYGDLDVSTIDELPPGRESVKTLIAPLKDKEKVYNFIEGEIEKGGQVYIVCPLIEESEKVDAVPIMLEYESVRKRFPDVPAEFLHGRMKGEEKERIMGEFSAGRFKILVTTTVIEVGVDVPNASVMVILDAQRYGLGQLHQLRGRVGRGSRKSYCILVADSNSGEDARKRLQILMKTSSGFEIAEEDLKIRGPGDFAGVRQSGLPDVKFLDITRDFRIIKEAREEAFLLEKDDPDLSRKENILIREKLHNKYKKIWDIIH
jgi:ATP-dependent DNA helicase RecG